MQFWRHQPATGPSTRQPGRRERERGGGGHWAVFEEARKAESQALDGEMSPFTTEHNSVIGPTGTQRVYLQQSRRRDAGEWRRVS